LTILDLRFPIETQKPLEKSGGFLFYTRDVGRFFYMNQFVEKRKESCAFV